MIKSLYELLGAWDMRFAQSKIFRKTLSFRMVLSFSLVFAAGIIISFSIAYYEVSYSLAQSNKEIISSKLNEMSAILSNRGVHALKNYFSIDKNRISNASFLVRVFTLKGDTLFLKSSIQDESFQFEKFFKNSVNPQTLLGWQSLPAIHDEDKFDILTQSAGENYYIQVGKSSEDREGVLEGILSIFGLTGVLLIVAGGGFGMWYAIKILKPLRELSSTMSEIQKGDFTHRVVLTEVKDELYDLGFIFNQMISRIESLVRIMRESLDNVAHDIRTPLTRIKVVAEDAIISNNPLSSQQALEICAESANTISALVDQIIDISEAEAGALNLNKESVVLAQLIQNIVELYEIVALEKEISIQMRIMPQDLHWTLDRRKIGQAIANLLDNAIKFSPPNAQILIHAFVKNEMLTLSILDKGQGISDKDIPHVWDRLFRGDRSRSTKGSGLGLSIVKAIVVAHGGSVFVHSTIGEGSEFSFQLPQ